MDWVWVELGMAGYFMGWSADEMGWVRALNGLNWPRLRMGCAEYGLGWSVCGLSCAWAVLDFWSLGMAMGWA